MWVRKEAVKRNQGAEGAGSHWAVHLTSRRACISINRNRLDWTVRLRL